jgi:predicted TPR repeat methyltransferase
VPPRASDGYIVKAFDTFSGTFEAKLAQLEYRAPALVAEAIEEAGVAPSGALDVLEVGCGTGLCGPLLAPYARRLVGVDLSPGMLKHAARKDVYDLLVPGELTAFLRSSDEAAFDVIVSADTLVYFGPLEDVAAAAARALRPGGFLVFTLEEAGWEDASVPHAIQTHGRYNHRRDYVERALADAGFAVAIGHAELRLESGVPVRGLVVRGTKAAAGAPAPVEQAADLAGGRRA